MSNLAIVEIWGPKTGSELEVDTRASEAEEAVRACALRGLHPNLPKACVTRVVVTWEARWWSGRERSGYRVAVTISLPEPLDQDRERHKRWLRFWIESEVSVALLELINPITVEGVSVTPAARGQIE